MKKTFWAICALSSLSLVSACGEQVEKVKEGFDLQGEYQSDGSTEVSIQTEGLGCIVHEVDVTGTRMVITQTAIDNAECDGKEIGKIVTTTSLKIGDEMTTAPEAREMDLTIKKVEVTPLHDSWLKVFGADLTKDCDLAAVPVGTTVNVTGKDCGVLGVYPVKGSIYFGSFQLKGETLKLSNTPEQAEDHIGSESNPAERDRKFRITLSSR